MIIKNIFKLSVNNRLSVLLLCLPLSLMLMFSQQVSSQQFEVVGVIRDAASKNVVNAARINLMHGKVSATTDENGAFKINLTSSTSILSISAYGYQPVEVALKGRTSIDIYLFPDYFSGFYKQIDGVAGEIDNLTLTQSYLGTSQVAPTEVLAPDELLNSAFAGQLRAVTRSATPGMGASVFIRGLNSINANAQPLYVVDGVMWNNLYEMESIHQGFFSNPLMNIEMSDIESITVMKDGTSVYGSRASNGVILIRTRRAKEMATKISLNITTGLTSEPRTIPVLDAHQYRMFVSDIIGTSGLSNSEIEQLPYLNDDPSRSTYSRYHNNTSWRDEVYRNGFTQNYSINVTGGDEKAMYYFALGYTDNSGVLKTTDFGRYNMRLNADINLSKNFTFATNIGFSRIDRKLIDDGLNSQTSPAWISRIKSPFLSPTTFTSLGEPTTEYAYSDNFGIGNPQAIMDFSINTLKQNSFNIGMKPEYKISDKLSISNQFNYQVNKTNEDYYRPYLFAAPVYVKGVGLSHNARTSQVMRLSAIYNDLQAHYTQSFDENNFLNAFAGMRYTYEYYESDYAEGHNSMSNSSVNLMGGFSDIRTDGMNNEMKSISYYLNGDYNFGNRYFLNAAMSVDGSSRFGQKAKSGMGIFGQRWAVFPSLNAAWLISAEEFMKNTTTISLLKLRAGYGMTGNDDIGDYQSKAYFSSVRLRAVSNGLVLSSLANPYIQWETTGRANAGVDLGVLNDRLLLSLDVFSATTQNLLVLKDYQDVAGLSKYWTNDGKLSNKGFEVSLNAKVLQLRNFGWELSLSAGHYKNEIKSLGNGSFVTKVFDGEVISEIGQSAGVFYGYKSLGVFASESDALQSGLKIPDGKGGYVNFGAGDVIFDDFHQDGIIDENDRQVIGNPNPKLYGSFTNKFSVGNFSISALITYSYGNDVYNYQRSKLESGSSFNNQSPALLSRWTSEGQITAQPRAVFGDPMGNARFSDRWIEDGSYVRLKSLMLSYNLPIKSNFVEGVNLWCSAGNLFTITKYLGPDPEFSASNAVLFQGVDAGLLPLSRTYFLGVKINL